MRLAQTLEPGLDDAVGEPKKPGLHILRKRRNLRGDDLIQDFDPLPLYLLMRLAVVRLDVNEKRDRVFPLIRRATALQKKPRGQGYVLRGLSFEDSDILTDESSHFERQKSKIEIRFR